MNQGSGKSTGALSATPGGHFCMDARLKPDPEFSD